MRPIYDPILGEMRASDADIAQMMKGDGLILHLPFREDGEDRSANQLQPYAGSFDFIDGWAAASGQVLYDLSAFEPDEITMTGNLTVPANAYYVDVFGLESNWNTFYWQKRSGNRIVLETIDGSFDFNIGEAGNGTPFHISAVYDGRQILCYLNGVLLDSSGWSLRFPNAVFSFWESACRFSDVRLYGRALNEAEINDIYQQDRRD